MMRSIFESSRFAAQRDALNAEHSNIRNSLNVETMVQFLNSKSLLTSDETYRLADTSQPLGKKVDFLVGILPRKESDWWDKFLHCLDESSARPGLGVHKEIADRLRDQLNRQVKKYEQKHSLVWIPMWYIKRITIRHQKTAFKIGTIFAILMVAICILGRSDTFIINTEISANDNKSELESTSSAHDNILKKLIPAVENCDDKSDATESSFQGNSTLHDSTSKIQNLTDAVTNMNNKAHTDENIKSRSTDNSTSHTSATSHTFSNKSSTLMQNTSRKAEKQSEHKVTTERKQLITKHLPTSQPDDMEVMQKQLNLTHCLFFYVEKEKMEYAKLDLWRVYVALKNIPPNVTTTTEKRIMFVTETLTDWNIEDLTISKQLMNELASTTGAIQQLKNLLSITDVKIMRLAQYGCEINQQLMLKQVMTNYESENALLRLKHELYILRPRVTTSSNTNVVVPLLYYPLLQRYVSLLVDTFSAKNDCLKSMQFCLHS